MTNKLAGEISPAEQGSDGGAVEYATITVKVPVNRIGSVFGCMRNLHKADKRLSRISYKKHTKIDYTKCTEPAPIPSESSGESVSELTDISRSSIRDMVKDEIRRALSKNDYKKPVPEPIKPEPKSDDVIPPKDGRPRTVITLDAKHGLCECIDFKLALDKEMEKYPDIAEATTQVMRNKWYHKAKSMPCNVMWMASNFTTVKECKTAVERRSERELEARRVEVERKRKLQQAQKCSNYEEERYQNRAHKSYVKNMKTSIPSKQEILECRRIIEEKVEVYGQDWTNDQLKCNNDLRCYRIDNNFYNAKEFSDIYHGMGWFRKKQWNKNFN